MSANQKLTFTLSLASILIATITLIQSCVSRDTANAVKNLGQLAGEANKQSRLLSRQVGVLSAQTREQQRQSATLSAQAQATSDQAASAQRSVEVAQRQLVSSEAAFAQQRRDSVAAERYAIRLQAMSKWVEADAAYYSILEKVRSQLFVDLEKPSHVRALSLAQLDQLRAIVEPVNEGRGAYQAAFRATMAGWPTSIRTMMINGSEHGNAIGECFSQPATRAVDEEQAAIIRERIIKACSTWGYEWKAMQEDSEFVWAAMAREVYRAITATGVDPERLSPGQLPYQRKPRKEPDPL